MPRLQARTEIAIAHQFKTIQKNRVLDRGQIGIDGFTRRQYNTAYLPLIYGKQLCGLDEYKIQRWRTWPDTLVSDNNHAFFYYLQLQSLSPISNSQNSPQLSFSTNSLQVLFMATFPEEISSTKA